MRNDMENQEIPHYRVGNPKFAKIDTKYSRNMHRRLWVGLFVLIFLEALLFSACLLFAVIDKSSVTDYYMAIVGSAGGVGILIAVALATWLW